MDAGRPELLPEVELTAWVLGVVTLCAVVWGGGGQGNLVLHAHIEVQAVWA